MTPVCKAWIAWTLSSLCTDMAMVCRESTINLLWYTGLGFGWFVFGLVCSYRAWRIAKATGGAS